MNQKKIHAQILENAKTLTTLHEKITETHKLKTINPVPWQTASDNFWSQYNRLAFPGGLKEGLEGLKTQDPHTIMVAIEFLKIDPYYHRSGYNKKKIVHLLKNVPLSEQQIADLQEVMLASLKIKGPFYQEYCRLARKIQNPEFIAKIKIIIAQSANTHEVSNAQKMLFSTNH